MNKRRDPDPEAAFLIRDNMSRMTHSDHSFTMASYDVEGGCHGIRCMNILEQGTLRLMRMNDIKSEQDDAVFSVGDVR